MKQTTSMKWGSELPLLLRATGACQKRKEWSHIELID
jgi:hypothetical protein